MTRSLCFAIALSITFAAACSDLPDIQSNVCGNGAIEDGEDCDGAGSGSGTCGAAGTANACHFVCDTATTCPGGFACGTDGRCRAPGGAFATPLGPYPFGATEFRAGDVDGDGFDDLVGVDAGRVEVRFGVASGDLASVVDEVLPAGTGTPDFGDLDGDGRLDLMVPTQLGLVTLRGSAARSFDPFPYASLALQQSSGEVRVEAVQAQQDFGFDAVIAFDTLGTSSGMAHNQIRAIDGLFGTCLDGTLVGIPPFPADCPSDAQAPTIADLVGGDVLIGRSGFQWQCGTPCVNPFTATGSKVPLADDHSDEVVIALVGSPVVQLLSTIEADDAQTGQPIANTVTLRPVQTIALPAGHVVAPDGKLAFADLDADGCNDLVIPVVATGASNPTFAIAYNDCATGAMRPAVLVNNSDVTPLPGEATQMGIVRAAFDVNGDGVADIITDKKIILTIAVGQGAGKWKGGQIGVARRAWTSVVVADVNHDGVSDFAGIVAGDPDVDVMIDNQALFDDFTVATSDPLRYVVAGDFDGDLVPDIGIVTGDTTSTSEDDAMAIIFGDVSGGPTAPVDQGHLGVVRSIAPIALLATAETLDGAEDLVVVTDTTGGRKGALVLGSTDRQLVAPFLVTGPTPPSGPAPGSSTPLAVIDGQFDASTANDLLVFARDPLDDDNGSKPIQTFLLSGVGGGDLDNVAQYTATTDLHELLVKPAPLAARGPLTSGGADSIVIVHSPNTPGGAADQCPVGATTLLSAPPPPPGVQPYDAATTWTLPAVTPMPAMASSCQKIHGLQMADLDGDGIDETLIDVCDATPKGSGTCVGAVIPTVGGVPSLAQAVVLPPSDLSCGRFAPLQLDDDPALELAGACSGASGSFLVLLDQQNGAWSELARLPIASVDDGRVTVGDFNGDKVPDVAVASGSGGATQVTVYIQCVKGDASCAKR